MAGRRWGADAYITTTRANMSMSTPGDAYPAAYCPTGWNIIESWNYVTIASQVDGGGFVHYTDWTETLCSK